MQIILFGVGLVVTVVIFNIFVKSRLPKEYSFMNMLDEMMNDSYDSEEESEENEEENGDKIDPE